MRRYQALWRSAVAKWPSLDLPYRKELASYRAHGKRVVHILHIGKTGGTAIKEVLHLHRDTRSHRIELHSHGFTLQDVPAPDEVIFFLRDPIGRFVSAFNSRLREGRPRHYSPWTKGEARAFSIFPTANSLALALSSPDVSRYQEAVRAMRDINHVKQSYFRWLQSEDYLLSRRDAVLMVGFQEDLERDFEKLKRLLGLPVGICLPEDDIRAHRAPPGTNRHLEEPAIRNLQQWYQRDCQLLDMCRREFSE